MKSRDGEEVTSRELEECRKRIAELEAEEAEHIAIKEELRDSEVRFRAVAQTAVDAIISTDTRDRIIFWNKAAQSMFGFTEQEALGQAVTIIIPDSHKGAHRNGVRKYLDTGEPALIGRTAELPALRKDGTEFPIELSLATWKAKGETFFTGIIRDITERKEAERELQLRTDEAKRRKDELESLVQMVAHDLKSPVVTIAGLTRLLTRKLGQTDPEGKTAAVLEQLAKSGEAMETFLKDLLDGLAAESTEPVLTPTTLHEVVAHVIDRHRAGMEKKGIQLQVDVPRSLPQVRADERRLVQVLDNLIINAIRYMGTGPDPAIQVRASRDGESVVVSVSDNGMGIAEDFQARIFDRFFRVPGSGVSIGTGLGLSIVKKIVTGHGGKIWVESGEGRGSTFSFTLRTSESDSEGRSASEKV